MASNAKRRESLAAILQQLVIGVRRFDVDEKLRTSEEADLARQELRAVLPRLQARELGEASQDDTSSFRQCADEFRVA